MYNNQCPTASLFLATYFTLALTSLLASFLTVSSFSAAQSSMWQFEDKYAIIMIKKIIFYD